jgi:hypothetical protein
MVLCSFGICVILTVDKRPRGFRGARGVAKNKRSSRYKRDLSGRLHWPRDLTDEQILERLLALNLERAAA